MKLETVRVEAWELEPEGLLHDGLVTAEVAQQFVGLRATGHRKSDGFLSALNEVVAARVIEGGQAMELDIVWTFDRR